MSKSNNHAHRKARIEARISQYEYQTRGMSEGEKHGYHRPGSGNAHKGSAGTPSTHK